jgi:hypothetical protein
VLLSALEVYERAVALGGTPAHAARVAEMRRAFESRTGAFGHRDPFFEPRSRAFWDDALTRQGFAREVSGELGPDAAPATLAFARAYRGIFRASEESPRFILRDAWSGAELVVDAADDGSREALHAAAGLFDARVVATLEPLAVTILPGALFHPEDASDSIEAVLDAARAKSLATDDVLDSLLRMERSFRSLSRVKAGYAYRPDALR